MRNIFMQNSVINKEWRHIDNNVFIGMVCLCFILWALYCNVILCWWWVCSNFLIVHLLPWSFHYPFCISFKWIFSSISFKTISSYSFITRSFATKNKVMALYQLSSSSYWKYRELSQLSQNFIHIRLFGKIRRPPHKYTGEIWFPSSIQWIHFW